MAHNSTSNPAARRVRRPTAGWLAEAVGLALKLAALGVGIGAFAQGPENVLVVINDSAQISRSIGEYYARRRLIPAGNLCRIQTTTWEEVARPVYDRTISTAVANCLSTRGLTEKILYIVTTTGVPLRIVGTGGLDGDIAAVDSELTLLYSDLRSGQPHRTRGMIPNPFFKRKDAKFGHPQFPIYLVTRLTAYDFPTVRDMIDRGLQAGNRGKFVIDLKAWDSTEGNEWLRDAAISLPKERVVYDDTATVLYKQTDVIGYASWGSNDPNRRERLLNYKWLPGAIATEFVSTNGRTFAQPPQSWNISDWKQESQPLWFAGSPQTMTGDFLMEGATGASGHVTEPFLMTTPRPDFVLPAYFRGRNLAESFYLGLSALSWQNVIVGDPLCSLGPPPQDPAKQIGAK